MEVEEQRGRFETKCRKTEEELGKIQGRRRKQRI